MGNAIVLDAGFYASIQDRGRWHNRHLGVPVSGCMSSAMTGQGNRLLGNSKDAAVLEMIMQGVTLQFRDAAVVAIVGEVDELLINDRSVKTNIPHQINAGDGLKIGRIVSGNYAYLAIKGGWQTEESLGSKSMFEGITKSGRITSGDELEFDVLETELEPHSIIEDEGNTTSVNRQNHRKDPFKIKAAPGPEFDLLRKDLQTALTKQTFILSRSWNRMAYTFHTDLATNLPQIPTAPVLPGTVQLTPSGSLIILMRDAQTTGGYPRILQLNEDALNEVVKMGVGDEVGFETIDFIEALSRKRV